jgi:phosphoribosyl 1,2-cyclic phosphodiesterase
MKSIRLISLYSGSTGNSFLLVTPTASILIDAGKSAKRLCMALNEAGVDPDSICAILVTHEHTDHISALPVFLKKHPIPVHLPKSCVYRLERDAWVQPLLHPHEAQDSIDINGVKVQLFPTPHDSRGSVGFCFEIPQENAPAVRIGYATDIGYITKEIEQHLLGCRAVILESNHDLEMLENGPYPYDLKLRVSSRRGHLSNSDSATFAAHLCKNGTCALMLAHLSQENNIPDIAFDECVSAVGDERVSVCIAHPENITELCLENIL